jgi:integral membrane protein
VSQAQPTTEQILDLRKEKNTALKNLTIIGYLEGTSFLLLLCIAMPLKYMMGIPEGVKYIGMAHGILFIAYIVILMVVVNKIKMPLWAMPAGVLGSFLPFGPFVFDHLLKKSLNKSVTKDA